MAAKRTYPPKSESAKVSEACRSAKDEMEAVFLEGTQLKRMGKLDAGAIERLESKMEVISERLDPLLSKDLAFIRTSNTIFPQAGWKRGFAFLILLALVGNVLESTVGERFVFSYSNSYKAVLPTIFALTLPAIAVVWFRLEKQDRVLSIRSPTWAVRWLMVYPLMVVVSSILVVCSPFGWFALGGLAIGSETRPRPAMVLSVGSERIRMGKCDQKAELEIDGIQANICIEDRVVGPKLKAGNTILIQGRSSFLGLFIDEILVMHSS